MENAFEIKFKCFICGNQRVNFWAKKQKYSLYKCSQCKLIFVHPFLILNDFNEIYSVDYFIGAQSGFGYVDYEQEKKAMVDTLNVYVDKIEKFVPEHGRLLDIGAATGSFLEVARDRGWQVAGIEISDYAASQARKKGLDVSTGQLKDGQYENNSFNAIVLLDVIEHLTNPEKVLKISYNLLKSGGIVLINTPNTGSLFAKLMGKHWHLIVPPEHLFYFDVDNLSKLLEKIGFQVELKTSIGKKFTIQYIFKTLAGWCNFFLWRWIANRVKNTSLGRYNIPINLRDNCFIIARKKI